MNATYIQKPVSFPSVRLLSDRMFFFSFLSHGARTNPAPPRIWASLTHQPTSNISSHCALLKLVTTAQTESSKKMLCAKGVPPPLTAVFLGAVCLLLRRSPRSLRLLAARAAGSLGSFPRAGGSFLRLAIHTHGRFGLSAGTTNGLLLRANGLLLRAKWRAKGLLPHARGELR